MTSLWDPIQIGRMNLAHRLAMSPLTRSRAQDDGTPGELAAEYYAQRASLGLLISEGTQPSADGQGFLNSPGIYSEAHVAGWRKVADAVHAAGGHLYIQVMHAGRMSHPANTPHGRQAVAPSAIAPEAQIHTPTGMQQVPAPRALSPDEIQATVRDYRHAAARHRGRRRRRGDTRRQRLPDPAVPLCQRQPSRRCLWRARRAPHALRAGGRGRRSRGNRRRPHRHPAFARLAPGGASTRARTTATCIATWWRAWRS
ncbi:oxidoreductase [Bordetella parapertussis]|nr:oxidoreductase [Bordetella parapertussis]